MNILKFNIFEDRYTQVQILVDGEDLLPMLVEKNSFMNLSPNDLYNGLTNKEFNDDLLEDDDRSIIYVCTCSFMGCDCLYMKMEQTEEYVTWGVFSMRSQGDSEYSRSFKFTRENYNECLNVLEEYRANK